MIEINKIKSPFIYYCQKVIPLAFDESLSYYEVLCHLTAKIKEVIDEQNIEGQAIEELQQKYLLLVDYVDNYFDNLDVQEEINNKLDEMAESGELEDLIGQYIQLATTYVYDNVDDMCNAENLVNGSYARTSGFYEFNDNGGAYYKIRTITSEDTIDNMTLFALVNNNTLVAELIYGETINIACLGAKTDNEYNDSYINKALELVNKVYIPEGVFKIQNPINIKTNKELYGIGKNKTIIRKDEVSYYDYEVTFTYQTTTIDYSDKDSIINIIPIGESPSECSNVYIHDLTLVSGAPGSSVSASKIGIFAPITSFSMFKNIRIMRCNKAINLTGWINLLENLEMLDNSYTFYTTLSIANTINKCHSNNGSYYIDNSTNTTLNECSADGGNPCYICQNSETINLNSCSTETPYQCLRCENAYTVLNGGDYLGYYQSGIEFNGFFVTQGNGKLIGNDINIRYTGNDPTNKNIIQANNGDADITGNIDVSYTYKNYLYGTSVVKLNDKVESNKFDTFNKVKVHTNNTGSRYDILSLPISYGIGYSFFIKASAHYLQSHGTFNGCINVIWGGAQENRVKVEMNNLISGDNSASLTAGITAEIDNVNNLCNLYFTSNNNWSFELTAEIEYAKRGA